MPNLGSLEQPLRAAIIGSGPSGFYAAEALLSSSLKVQVDLFDRLPAPFGLVRYGVAPDHPKIKNVTKVFEKIAAHENFNFLGNVSVGKDIQVKDLLNYYDAVIFASGAQTDRRLGIPGEDLPGSYTATEFVAWYNGHPEYLNRKFDLSADSAVIIGQGNVAMDVARILAKSVDELKATDIAAHALEALSKSNIKTVYLVGRRGPVQAAFSPPEIKEFAEIKDCDILVDPEDLNLNPESQKELEDVNVPTRRKNFEVLKEYAQKPAAGKRKKLIIDFFKSPLELKGNSRLESVTLEKNQLTGPAGQQQAVGTGKKADIKTGILFRSVGYRGISIPGVPFDEKKGIFPNQEGRILEGGKPVPGLYATGWIKRGPSGVIGTNKPDSVATVQSLLADMANLQPSPQRDTTRLVHELKTKGVQVVHFNDWKKIDAAEVARGKALGKPREKFVKVEDMLKAV